MTIYHKINIIINQCYFSCAENFRLGSNNEIQVNSVSTNLNSHLFTLREKKPYQIL